MKLAFSQATQDVATLFGSYCAAGYDGLQLKANQYMPYMDAPRRFVDEHGGTPGAASGLIAMWSRKAEATEQLRKVIAFGSAVGTELLIVCHYEKRELFSDDDIRAAAKQLSALGAEARAAGVKLSLHHHFDNPVMHRKDFTTFFDAIEPGTVGLTIDTAHLAKSGVTDMGGLIRDMRGVIDNFHLKDFRAGEFRVLGDGDVPFDPVFAAIREIGYDGWISADEESGADVRAAMQQCMQVIRRGLAMNVATVVRGNDVAVEQTPWGSLQWLVGARNGASRHLTVGRVTFKPGQSNPRHHHPNCEEVLVVVSGDIEHTLPEGGTVRLAPGDCIVLPQGEGHCAKNVGTTDAVVLVAFNNADRMTVGEKGPR